MIPLSTLIQGGIQPDGIIVNFFKDWLKFFQDDNFQQDLVFLIIIFAGKIMGVYDENTFTTLVVVVIGGDAVKKLGEGK